VRTGDAKLLACGPSFDMTRHDDGTTILTVSVADQAQLHGVLAGLRDIGVVLVEPRITGAPAAI
jgi:hypothetical protein